MDAWERSAVMAGPLPCIRTFSRLLAGPVSLSLAGSGLGRLLGVLGELAPQVDLINRGHDPHDEDDGYREYDEDVAVEGLDLLRLVAEGESVPGAEDGSEPEQVVADHHEHGEDPELAQRQDAACGRDDEKPEKVSSNHDVYPPEKAELQKGRLHI